MLNKLYWVNKTFDFSLQKGTTITVIVLVTFPKNKPLVTPE